jgi:hypothetical protein
VVQCVAENTLSYLGFLSNNLGDVSNKCGGRFHQMVFTLEKCYQRK